MHVTVTSPSWSTAAAETLAPIARATRWTNSLRRSSLGGLPGCGGGGIHLGDDVGGRVPDPEQAPLSLRDDLEPHALAVEAGDELLELTERGPLRLADGLAGCLDSNDCGPAHRFGLPPRFRLTFRGGPERDWPCAAPRSGAAASAGAGVSRPGVRLVRLGGI